MECQAAGILEVKLRNPLLNGGHRLVFCMVEYHIFNII